MVKRLRGDKVVRINTSKNVYDLRNFIKGN